MSRRPAYRLVRHFRTHCLLYACGPHPAACLKKVIRRVRSQGCRVELGGICPQHSHARYAYGLTSHKVPAPVPQDLASRRQCEPPPLLRAGASKLVMIDLDRVGLTVGRNQVPHRVQAYQRIN